MVHQELSGALRLESYEDPKNSSFSGFSVTGLHQDLQVTLVQAHLKHVHDAEKPAIAQWPIDSLSLCCLIYVISLIFECGLLLIHWNTPLLSQVYPKHNLQQKTRKTANTQHAFKVTELSKATTASSSSDDLFFLTTALKAPRHFVEVLEGSPSVEMQQKKTFILCLLVT